MPTPETTEPESVIPDFDAADVPGGTPPEPDQSLLHRARDQAAAAELVRSRLNTMIETLIPPEPDSVVVTTWGLEVPVRFVLPAARETQFTRALEKFLNATATPQLLAVQGMMGEGQGMAGMVGALAKIIGSSEIADELGELFKLAHPKAWRAVVEAFPEDDLIDAGGSRDGLKPTHAFELRELLGAILPFVAKDGKKAGDIINTMTQMLTSI